jgi:hypothetical protein
VTTKSDGGFSSLLMGRLLAAKALGDKSGIRTPNNKGRVIQYLGPMLSATADTICGEYSS